jgi:hypothetical protein
MPGDLGLSVAFFLSGAAGLVFQIVWFYQCGLVFGSSIASVTIVLSSFMGGLALGFGGLALVVWQKLGVGEISGLNFLLALGALLSITAGTAYQIRVRSFGGATGKVISSCRVPLLMAH